MLEKVKFSAMTARQPSVPNLITLMEKLLRVASSHRCGGFGNFAHLFYAGFHAAEVKKGGAADKTVRAGVRAISDGFEIHSTVHADVVIKIFLVPPFVGLLDFGQGFVDKCLTAETGV